MIVPMKRLTLLSMATEKQFTLEVLHDIGAVHVTHVNEPAGEDLERAQAAVGDAQRGLELVDAAIEAHEAEESAKSKKKEVVAPTVEPRTGLSAEEAMGAVLELGARRKETKDTLAVLSTELERIESLGEFEPAQVRQLAAQGITVRLFHTQISASPTQPEGLILREIGKDDRHRYFVVAGPGEFALEDLELDAPVVEVRLPERSLAETRERITEQQGELARIDQELAAFGSLREELSGYAHVLEERAEFIRVREGMGQSEAVSFLRGYVPEEEVANLRTAAAENGWGLVVENPRKGESVPTLIRYPRIVRPIKALFDVLKIMPSYWETDVSWTFLVFFTLFVGLLIGDTGYGLLFLGVAIFASIKSKSPNKSAIVLLYMMSISIIVFGVLSGSWLGISPLPAFLESLRVEWLSSTRNVMALCFLIGAVHLTIAHAWNALTEFPRVSFLAQLGWMAIVWSMFFLARSVVLGYAFPSFVIYLLAAGGVLVILFMTPPSELKQNWMNHVLLPLTLVSFFVDIISYVRLFAVGVATVAVMQSFNGMAASIGFDNVLTAVFAIVILVFGHSLNLVLCALAVLVHGVRLNTLEFSTHKGLSWSGYLFQPFARKS